MHGIFALALVVFLVAGCASDPSPIGVDQIRTLRLTDITVQALPDASIMWDSAEHEFVTAARAANPKPAKAPVVETASLPDTVGADNSDYSALAKSSDGQAYVRNKAAARIKEALDANLKPALQSGSRPVRLEVAIRNFVIPSPIQRVVIGGVPMVVATAVLKDAQTGQVLATKENVATAPAGNGVAGVLIDQAFSDLDLRVAGAYAESYRGWLLHES